MDSGPRALLFSTRVAALHATNNIRRLLREVMEDAKTKIEKVTSHRFRCTVATVVNDAQGRLLVSELLGHTDPRITVQHYMRNETVNPVTVEHLERAIGRAG